MFGDQPVWLSIDEQTDVIASLSGCSHCLSKIGEEPAFWKHVIVNLHNALQGAMVCHLSGTAQMGALDQNSFQKIAEWHERDRRGEINHDLVEEDGWQFRRVTSATDQFPNERLADARTLFKRVYTESKRTEVAGNVLTLSRAQIRSFEKLHSLRNDFAHFTPKGWSIELAGLPRICLDVRSVLALIVDDGWGFRHLADDKRLELNKQLSMLQGMLQAASPGTV
jgi:hypothetical protein